MSVHNRIDVDTETLVVQYVDGCSVAWLSTKYGVSEKTIRRRLHEAGIPLRGLIGRDGQVRSMLVGARGRTGPLTDAALERRALANQRSLGHVGRDEALLIELLRQRGADVVPQQAVGPYNLDIGWAPLAIELHSDAHYPLTRRIIPKRVEFLRENGWLPIYVWMLREHSFTEGLADELVRFHEEVGGQELSHFETRVVRFNGTNAVKFQKRY